MAQLTLYIEEDLLKKIEIQSKKEKSSISRWVSQKLTLLLNRSWPPGFLELAGALKESDLDRPLQEKKHKDARKVKL